MRFIDADRLQSAMWYAFGEQDEYINKGMAKWDSGPWVRYKAVEEVIDAQPTIEAEPVKHEKWIEVQRINPTDRMAICECSNCGDTIWVYDGQRTWNYCPNCGAKMNEVKE